ncbi:MAG: hypothetical protein ACTSRI_08495 [Promethearchaeota archaeon]
MEKKEKLTSRKKRLLDLLITNSLLRDRRLIQAFMEVPLEDFIPKKYIDFYKLYQDIPNLFYYQNSENYRTISAPHMITIMLQGLSLEKNDDLLILGAKSGYIAALAHKLCPNGEIIILEANSDIAKITLENLKKLNLDNNIDVIVKNPLEGMPNLSPWQKILVTGAIKQQRIHPLLTQLDPKEGVLYAPIGEDFIQIYTQILRIDDNYYGKRKLQVRFTPLMTKIELDDLELITDFEEIKIKDDPNKVDKTLGKIKDKYEKKININYASRILDDIELEQDSDVRSFDLNVRDKAVSYLKNIEKLIKKLKNEDDIEKRFNYIHAIETQVENLRQYKKSFNIKVKRIQSMLNQINAFNIVIKELEKKEIVNVIDKKIELLNLLFNEINKFQESIKEEIKRLNNL